MILEVIRYVIEDGLEADFEKAYAEAAKILDRSAFCQSYRLTRSKKEAHRYLLLIEWESAEAHLEGFRKSADFPEFFRLVKPFFKMLKEMEHYEITNIAGTKNS